MEEKDAGVSLTTADVVMELGEESSNSKVSGEIDVTVGDADDESPSKASLPALASPASLPAVGSVASLPAVPSVASSLPEQISTPTTPTRQLSEAKIAKSASSRVITADTTHLHVEPSHVIEYEWPPKSGERFFIQEQIAELLGIKSFKRKYPELSRRTIEISEREYLMGQYNLATVINEHQMHGLTALRAIEVHELMASDYPSIYSEYQKATADKVKLQMAEDQKRLDAIKLDSKKMEELRKSAIRSAHEYNAEMNAAKRTERRHFWDIQTSIIQSARNRWKRLPPEKTRVSPYPAALINGQYQEYYRKFTPAEMRKLPLATVLDYDYLLPPPRQQSPPPIIVHEEELMTQANSPEEVDGQVDGLQDLSIPVLEPAETKTEEQVNGKCSVCGECNEAETLQCSTCNSLVHPDCAGLPEHVMKVARSYKWNCIECKNCTVCEKPDDEDAMMFCDLCDRGYHTFCVGLSEPPNGTWICSLFCAKDSTSKADGTS